MTREHVVVLKRRIGQTQLMREKAFAKIQEGRTSHSKIDKNSVDQNGKLYHINNEELNAVGRILINLLHEVERNDTDDFDRMNLWINTQCQSLETRINNVYAIYR